MGIKTQFDVQNHLNLLWVHSVTPKLTIWMNKDYLMIQSFLKCIFLSDMPQNGYTGSVWCTESFEPTSGSFRDYPKLTIWMNRDYSMIQSFKVSLNAFFSRICLKMGIQTQFDVQNHLNLLWVHSVATKIDHLNKQRLLDDSKFP